MDLRKVRSKVSRRALLSKGGIRHVGLKVFDLEKSCRFYRDILGLPTRAKGARTAFVRSGSDVIVLTQDKTGSSDFHFGFRLGSSSQVDEWRDWLRERGVVIEEDIARSDHPRSFKFRDPDGFVVEIAYDSSSTNPRVQRLAKV